MARIKKYFNGWFISYNARRIHFFINGVSLCKKWKYKSRRASDIKYSEESDKFCKKCLAKLM